MRCFRILILVAAGVVGASAQACKPYRPDFRKPPNESLSLHYSVLAAKMAAEIRFMADQSMELDNDLFSKSRQAFEDENLHALQCDLSTAGDGSVNTMLGVAMGLLFAHRVDVSGGHEDEFGMRWSECLRQILHAIAIHRFSGYGACSVETKK